MNMSTSTFVGRETETKTFQGILDKKIPKSGILYLQGDGGLGKTRLLERFQDICLDLGTPFTQIIDFHDTSNQLVLGVMDRIDKELSNRAFFPDMKETPFQPFVRFRKLYDQVKKTGELSPDPEKSRYDKQKTEDQFIADYNQMTDWFAINGKRPVLFFDTFEVVQDFGDVNRWFLRRFIPAVRNTIIVFAGRNKLQEDVPFTLTDLEIGCFSVADTKEYFRNRNILIPELPSKLQQLHALTEGNPLLITLVADWAIGHPSQVLAQLLGQEGTVDTKGKERFRQRLIGDVLRLDLPDEYEAVWYMAHIFHRFNVDILAVITGKAPDEAAAVIANLSQFPFVKYRPQSRSYQLQDVMRELVRKHVLDEVEDTDGHLRRDLSESMIKYYDREISLQSNAQRYEANVMRVEQLYHYFYVSREDGFALFEKLSKDADDEDDIAFGSLLLSNAREYYNSLAPDQQVIFDMYEGWLTKRIGKPSVAEPILRKCLDFLKRSNHLVADLVASSLGHTYKELGRFSDARQMYLEALSLNNHSAKDPRERKKAGAQILNNLGNLCRLQGKVHEAHRYCMESLILRLQLRESEGLAHSYYVLGLVLREFGDNTGAMRFLARAETEYSRLSEWKRQKGLANVMRARAYIYNHVREHEKAIELAKESYRILAEEIGIPSPDLADALDILGRLIRDKAVDDYQQNRNMNEETALIQRDKDLRRAEDYIEQAYRMAQQVGDRFKEAESVLSFVRLFNVRGEYQRSLEWYARGMDISRPRDYYLLLCYFESIAGSDHFALGNYDQAFERFAWRTLFATQCREMELGMTMDSIGTYLERLKEPQLMAKYADYLVQVWNSQPEWGLQHSFPQIINLCTEIKGLVLS